MWNPYRYINKPEYSGYIIKAKVRCGKKNCSCAKRKSARHLAYYLYWREIQPDGTRKLRKRYVKKRDLYAIQRRLAVEKGRFFCTQEWVIMEMLNKEAEVGSSKEEGFVATAYLNYGGSRYAKQYLKDGLKWSKDVEFV